MDQTPATSTDAERLRELLALHAIALGSLTQGLCLLDADYRVVLFNRRYRELYGFSSNCIRVGISLDEILCNLAEQSNASRASAVAEREEYRRHLARREPFVQQHRLSDGTLILARFQPVAGEGWLSISDQSLDQHGDTSLSTELQRLNQVLCNTQHGLCLFDQHERLLFCNEQYLQIYGYDPGKVKPGVQYRHILSHATTLDHFSGVTGDQLYDRCMTAVQSRQVANYQIRLHDGRVIEKIVRPLPDGSWIADHEDITVRTRHEEALRERNMLLDAALEHMANGLCAFDQNLRVIVVNKRYLDMYGLDAEQAKPGTGLIDLMRHSIARGIHRPGTTAEKMFEDFTKRLIERKEPVLYRRLADGRVIAVRHQPMSNGGWVGTYEDITEQRKAEESIARMARHDALTDLPNRLLFRERMAEGLARVQAWDELMAVICIDLDNFKLINDSLGHPIGDKLLRKVAERLGSTVRECDTIARIGGDEFAILQFMTDRSATEALAERVLSKMAEPALIDGQEINTACSVGIAIAPDHGTDSDHLMQCADLALYAAKAHGRNTFRFFEPDMEAKVQERRTLEIDMRHALTAGQFELAYQPLVSAARGELVGMEALIRWTHVTRGKLSPSEFISVAEETGFIIPLGEWVLRNACREAAKWPESIKIAVNLSPVQFRGAGIVTSVMQALATAQVSPRRLELEITEAVLLQNDPTIAEILHRLRDLGVRICMDDFGTGYSSLSYLRSFPFDKIKIDRSFIVDVNCVHNAEAIVRAIAGLGTALGIQTTAEGVETLEQLELVRRAGCSEVQGYLISPPCSVSELPSLFSGLSSRAAVAA
jgi:diguanylate cyclase (GGDEF)-like protein/PAS domain S-box-containing protein